MAANPSAAGAGAIDLARLGFAEFAEAVRPTASVNRLPQTQMLGADDVLVYEVYFNGAAAKLLPNDIQGTRHDPLSLHPIAERLNLDPGTFRDTCKVAELMTVRSVWMNLVSRTAARRDFDTSTPILSGAIIADYEKLAKGIDHPWIQKELTAHRERLAKVAPALSDAAQVLGQAVRERAPAQVNVGVIVSRNEDFTVQAFGADGDVVAHDNRQLDAKPAVGDDVTISYYRGQGQVFDNAKELKVSAPYLDAKHNDLAVRATDADGTEQVVLFHGVSSYVHFLKAHGLDPASVEKAIEVMDAKLQQQRDPPARTPLFPPELDCNTGAIALHYLEDGAKCTALFDSPERLATLASEFGADPSDKRLLITMPQELERIAGSDRLASSRRALLNHMPTDMRLVDTNLSAGSYSGPVVAASDFHVLQDIGRGEGVMHSKFNLDKVPNVGTRHRVQYQNSRGRVENREQGHGAGRGR